MMLWGVILSIVIAVAASYTALDLAGRVAARKGWTFATWLTGGSLTMGVGILSMHFSAVLAFLFLPSASRCLVRRVCDCLLLFRAASGVLFS